MDKQIPLEHADRAYDRGADHQRGDHTHEIAPDLAYRRLGIVNVVFLGMPHAHGWVLIDAGVAGAAGLIIHAAEERFGKNVRPSAIVLTHGHFDHVGAVKELAEDWDVPVYAHPVEHPYLDGSASYPRPDPAVGGGLMARLSPLYPRGPIDLGHRLRPLASDGIIEAMPSWRWVHSPGHTPGHVSFWRAADRALIAGDAFITTRQESAYAVALQVPEMHGPPAYYTTDWESARLSVERLAALEPEIVICGHGPAMRGADMRQALHELAADFDRIAVPDHGRYVEHPAAEQYDVRTPRQ